MLEPRGRRASPRRARHLDREGQLDPCIDAWLRATFWLRAVDNRRALQAATHVEELLGEVALDDPRHVAVAFAHASVLAQLGRVSGADGVADAQVASGVARGDPLAEGLGWTLLSIVRRRRWDTGGPR